MIGILLYEKNGVSMCFTDFHGVQHAGTIVYNCLHGGILRTLSIVPAAAMLCFGTLTNSFKAVQHPVQAVILKDLAGML